ncbi:evasin P1126-like [Dermacentor silvarum]|uniref:evasin P1126-like n=1 Tax=Dermacentor silvarum TaxID=543639 RepID=UPI002100B079|nr:evasin P1126-like [Dermacentor silvarum]
MASYKVLRSAVYAVAILYTIIVSISESANLAKSEGSDELVECPEKCDKSNNYTCAGNCTCVYVAGNDKGTCFDLSGLDYL